METKAEPITVTTADLSERERFDYWRHAVASTFVPLRCEPPADFAPRMFNGRLRSLRLAGLQITEVSATPHVVTRSPKLISQSGGEFYKVNMQQDGNCMLAQDGREAALRPGDFAIYDTTRPYSIRLGRPYRTIVLLIPRRHLRISPDRVAELTARPISGQRGVGSLLSPFLTQFVASLDQFDNTCAVRLADNIVDLVDTLLVEHIDTASVYSDSSRRVLLLRIMAFIERQLREPSLDPVQIARAHSISTRYLHKLFHHEGITVAGWIRSRRLERCRRDLRDPSQRERPVSAVGARWGFVDAAHFSRVFRSAYGSSPTEYRAESDTSSIAVALENSLAAVTPREEGRTD